MAVRLSREAFPTLLNELKKYFPQTIPIHGALSVIARTEADESGVWVDEWPKFGAVLIRPNQHSTKSQVPFVSFEVKFFAKDQDSGKFLLSEQDVFSGKERVDFAASTVSTWPVIEAAGHAAGFDVDIEVGKVQMFYLPDFNNLPESIPVPEGYRMGDVDPKFANLLNSAWHFNLGKSTEPYMASLIHLLPSVGIYDKCSGELVTFAICYEDGAMGNLYVLPEHRRRGLASLAMGTLARKVHALGQTPFLFIEFDNPASVKLHERLGFIADQSVSWVCCKSKK